MPSDGWTVAPLGPVPSPVLLCATPLVTVRAQVRDEGQEPGAATGAAALYRADGYSEDLGRLGDGIALHVHEYERGALLGGQFGECGDELPVQILALCGHVCGLVRLQEMVEALRVVGERSTSGGGLTGAVEAGVDRDPVQPGRHGGLAAERVCRPVGGDEGVLDGVGRLFPVAEGAYRHGPEAVAVTSDDLAEGFAVAVDVPGEEFAVVEAVDPAVLRGQGGRAGLSAVPGPTLPCLGRRRISLPPRSSLTVGRLPSS